MQVIGYRLETLAPVIIADQTGDPNTLGCFGWIPGNTVLGASAAVWRSKNRVEADQLAHNPEFRALFLDGAVQFSHGYPAVQNYVGFPVPFSLYRAKDGDGVYDMLYMKKERPKPARRAGGFAAISDGAFTPVAVQRKLHFHHARDRESGTTAEGQIFNYEALEPGQSFYGELRGDAALLQQLQQLLPDGSRLRIGRSRTAEYGAVRIYWLKAAPLPQSKPQQGVNSVTLLSDYIPETDDGLTLEQLCAALGGRPLAGKEHAFLRERQIRSFYSAWGMPVAERQAVAAGSCFLIELDDTEQAQEALQNGIGALRMQGFGRVGFNLQQQAEPQWRPLQAGQQRRSQRPDGDPPAAIQALLQNIVVAQLEQGVRLKGVEDARRVTGSPSRSLLGRLERMVLDNCAQFPARIGELRDTAKNALRRVWLGNRNLYEYFQKSGEWLNPDEQLLALQLPEGLALFKKMPAETAAALQKEYLLTLLSALRKQSKIESAKEGRN